MKSQRSVFVRVGVLVLFAVLLPAGLRAEDSPLEKAMKNMQDAKKELYPAMKLPVPANKDKYIALAKVLKTEATTAKDLVPEMAEKLPPADKDAMVAAYRKDMDEFIKTTDSLIGALEKDQWAEAQTLVAKMKDQEKAGHKAYRPKKEKPGAPGAVATPPPAPGN